PPPTSWVPALVSRGSPSPARWPHRDRKSTRLNSSHVSISYAVFSKQQKISEIMRQMLTQAQTAGQYFTNDQIKEMTRKVSAEVDLVHQQSPLFPYTTLFRSPTTHFVGTRSRFAGQPLASSLAPS